MSFQSVTIETTSLHSGIETKKIYPMSLRVPAEYRNTTVPSDHFSSLPQEHAVDDDEEEEDETFFHVNNNSN